MPAHKTHRTHHLPLFPEKHKIVLARSSKPVHQVQMLVPETTRLSQDGTMNMIYKLLGRACFHLNA